MSETKKSESQDDPNGDLSDKPSFWAELKRRKVMRVAITYAVVSWVIIQVAATTFGSFGIPEWAFRFVVLMVILGFPVALIITWAFELTPEGIKTTKSAREEGGDEPVSKQYTRKRNWMTVLFAAALPTVIFGALALYFFFSRTVAESGSFDKSIAVLPFDNRSNVEGDQFFTDGIHDDLLTQISRIQDIKTISRTSVMAYRDTTKNMREIGAELGVATLLEGGVQRSGDQIRINMQLIDADTDAHIWAETYTREMSAENVFAIQSEITQAIAGALRTVLSPDEKEELNESPTKNIAALEAFFVGKQELNKRTGESIKRAIDHFQTAIDLDEEFAQAYAQMATGQLLLIFHEGALAERQTEIAEPLIESAIRLDKTLEDNYVALGMLERYKGSRMAALLAFEKAVELNPNNVEAYVEFGVFTAWGLGDLDSAVKLFRKALRVDPKNIQVKVNLASILGLDYRKDEALAILDSAIEDNSALPMLHHSQGGIYHFSFFDFPKAIKAYRRSHFLDPTHPATMQDMAQAYGELGDRDTMLFWLDRIIQHASGFENINAVRAQERLLREDVEGALDIYRSSPESGTYYPIEDFALLAMWSEDEAERAKAIEDAFALYPHLEGENPVLSEAWHSSSTALNIARMLCANDRCEEAQPLLREMLASLPERAEERWEAVDQITEAYLLAGDAMSALNELKRFVDTGGAFVISDERSPVLIQRDLIDDPEYQGLVAIMDERITAQRTKLAQWEANGELAPIPEL